MYAHIKNKDGLGMDAIIKMCYKKRTSGRLRAPIVVTGLNSGPIGIRMLCSNTSLDVYG